MSFLAFDQGFPFADPDRESLVHELADQAMHEGRQGQSKIPWVAALECTGTLSFR